MPTFHFELGELPPEAEALRAQVREFLRRELGDAPPVQRAHSWGGFDREFSRKMGARGWIAMTWPKRYGGHERSALERYVVLEEMLAAGAPVSAHWIADRQSGPLLLRFGTEAQRQKFLPAIARGELSFAIGMSEPDAGSDLASLRTRAERVDGGYRVNGTKVWTSNAHLADYMIATFRTHHDPAKKHDGLSQFLVDTKLQGITMSPIIDLAGSHHFNMVVLEDVFVPEDMRVGEEGAGWKQVTTELAFERSGPERYLSSLALVLELIRHAAKDPGERAAAVVGRLVAHLATLRQMSLSVAVMLQAGENPNLEAAVVKDVGTTFEQEIPEIVHALLGVEPTIDSGSDLQQVLGFLVQRAPSCDERAADDPRRRRHAAVHGPRDQGPDRGRGAGPVAGALVAGGRGERPDPAGRSGIEGRRRRDVGRRLYSDARRWASRGPAAAGRDDRRRLGPVRVRAGRSHRPADAGAGPSR